MNLLLNILHTKIYFVKPDGWADRVCAYVYDESSYDYTKQNRIWPGIEMTLEDNGLYSYTFTDEFAAPLVIFNDKKNQSNGTLEPGDVVEADKVYVVDQEKYVWQKNKKDSI